MNVEGAKQDLFEIGKILDKLKIKFWLTHGTLLGAVREKDFIKTDHDIDIRILAVDWFPGMCEKFKAVSFGCKVFRWYPPYITKLQLTKRVLTEIALEYYYPPDDTYVCLTQSPDDHMTAIPGKFYRGDCFIKFLGRLFRVPNPPVELLERYYGKDWRIPTSPKEFPGWVKGRKKISMGKYLDYLSEHPVERIGRGK